MNVVRLNEYLSGNDDAIAEILTRLDCTNIKYNAAKNEFRCSREYGRNPSSLKLNTDTLRFTCFSTNERGSIYNLVMTRRGLSFPESLRWVADTLELDKGEFAGRITLPFGGFYKKLTKRIVEPELAMKVYDDNILERYGSVTNLSFFDDGIDLKTQEFFRLGYDHASSRITIPQWNVNGELVGVIVLSYDPDIPYEYRWLPVIPCSRSYTLYGYHMNYADIQQRQTCIITESEKGVMQLRTMGYNNGLATCTKTISPVQERYLKALRVDKLILAYDEGISEDALRYEAVKLLPKNPIFRTQVGYINDKSREIMRVGSKCSPTDLGRRALDELLRKHTEWIQATI